MINVRKVTIIHVVVDAFNGKLLHLTSEILHLTFDNHAILDLPCCSCKRPRHSEAGAALKEIEKNLSCLWTRKSY